MADDGPPGAGRALPLVAAVRDTVARHRLLARSDHVLVAVSGGPDSVALLHALTALRPEYELGLTVCHVHHGLRPEADRDAAFVEALAGRLGCPVRIVRVHVPLGGGRSPEEAARRVRYAALTRLADETGARRVALGHTADDQAETVLMRLLQGAGPRGLAGIPVRRGRLVRPLLEVGRAAVEAYLAAQGLAAVEDATNRDPKFLRNRIRHELLPLLAAQVGPRVPEALRRVARASREAVESLDALVRPRLAGCLSPTPVGWRLDLAALDGLLPGAAKAVLRIAVGEVAAPDRLGAGLREPHLDALLRLGAAPSGARVRLPSGIVVERGRDAVWILSPAAAAPPAALSVPGRTRAGSWVVTATLGRADGGWPADPAGEAWFDWEALTAPGRAGPALTVRPPRAGERMVPFGGTTRIRLGRLLAAAGVPRLARARWPVVVGAGPGADGGEALWLVGARRAAAAPLAATTRTVLRLRVEVPGPAAAREGP
jgi:tRNA(Ile)-lysidine synthase